MTGQSSEKVREYRSQVETQSTGDDPRLPLIERIIASEHFAKSPQLVKFLRYICAQALLGRPESISEQIVGSQVFVPDQKTTAPQAIGSFPSGYLGENTVSVSFPDRGSAAPYDGAKHDRTQWYKGCSVASLQADTVERLAADLRRSTLVRKIALLPTVSYHMTVYPGANDQDREITGWPSDLPKDASIDECNRSITERMRRFHLQCDLPILMKVDAAKTIANPRASTVHGRGRRRRRDRIRTIRDRLVDVFHFRDAKHDEYGFHITLAYQLKPFTQAEQREYHAIFERIVPLIATSAPV